MLKIPTALVLSRLHLTFRFLHSYRKCPFLMDSPTWIRTDPGNSELNTFSTLTGCSSQNSLNRWYHQTNSCPKLEIWESFSTHLLITATQLIIKSRQFSPLFGVVLTPSLSPPRALSSFKPSSSLSQPAREFPNYLPCANLTRLKSTLLTHYLLSEG